MRALVKVFEHAGGVAMRCSEACERLGLGTDHNQVEVVRHRGETGTPTIHPVEGPTQDLHPLGFRRRRPRREQNPASATPTHRRRHPRQVPDSPQVTDDERTPPHPTNHPTKNPTTNKTPTRTAQSLSEEGPPEAPLTFENPSSHHPRQQKSSPSSGGSSRRRRARAPNGWSQERRPRGRGSGGGCSRK